jgi:hypothetical protein
MDHEQHTNKKSCLKLQKISKETYEMLIISLWWSCSNHEDGSRVFRAIF